MTCQILTKEESEQAGCQFEEWNKEKKDLCACGKMAIASVGRGIVCVEHLPDALIRCGSGAYIDEKTGKRGVAPQAFWTKEDFLNAYQEKILIRANEKTENGK